MHTVSHSYGGSRVVEETPRVKVVDRPVEVELIKKAPTDVGQRMKTIADLASDILNHGASFDDERVQPELRDILRIAQGGLPRTNVGKEFWAENKGVE
jgi:hypothetical protein